MTSSRPALRGEKERWLKTTLQHGLRRPSAAWFSAPSEELLTIGTAAAAVFLALAPRGRAQLSASRRDDSFTRAFHSDPGLLPALVRFRDKPNGDETWRQYQWDAGSLAAVTAPYTKVARAGRTVPLPLLPCDVARVDLDDIAHIEAGLPTCGGPNWWMQPTMTHRDGLDTSGPSQPVTRIGLLCERVGELLLTRLDPCHAHR